MMALLLWHSASCSTVFLETLSVRSRGLSGLLRSFHWAHVLPVGTSLLSSHSSVLYPIPGTGEMIKHRARIFYFDKQMVILLFTFVCILLLLILS